MTNRMLLVLWLATVVIMLAFVGSLVSDRRTLEEDNARLRTACGLGAVQK